MTLRPVLRPVLRSLRRLVLRSAPRTPLPVTPPTPRGRGPGLPGRTRPGRRARPRAPAPGAPASSRRPALPARASGLALAFLLAASTLGASACTLERRADPDLLLPEDTLLLAPDTLLEAPPAPPNPDRAVRNTLEVFREATRVGDLSLALQLLDTRAFLLDDLVTLGGGPADLPETPGERLLELRRRHAAGLGIVVEHTELRWTEDAAVATSTLVLTQRTEGAGGGPGGGGAAPGGQASPGATLPPPVPVDTVGRARETAVLRPTREGWRILHLHRSLVSPPAGG